MGIIRLAVHICCYNLQLRLSEGMWGGGNKCLKRNTGVIFCDSLWACTLERHYCIISLIVHVTVLKVSEFTKLLCHMLTKVKLLVVKSERQPLTLFTSWKRWAVFKVNFSPHAHWFYGLSFPRQELDGCDELHPAHSSAPVRRRKVWLCEGMREGCGSRWRTQPPWAWAMIYNAQTVGKGESLLCSMPWELY